MIEVKNGFSPEAVRDKLFRLTPLEESFNINNVALVNGQPKTPGLIDMPRVFLDHRVEVVTRRSEFRRRKALDRLHLLWGLLIATLNIDEVVAVIRSSDDDAVVAKQRLMEASTYPNCKPRTFSICHFAASRSTRALNWRAKGHPRSHDRRVDGDPRKSEGVAEARHQRT